MYRSYREAFTHLGLVLALCAAAWGIVALLAIIAINYPMQVVRVAYIVGIPAVTLLAVQRWRRWEEIGGVYEWTLIALVGAASMDMMGVL